MSLLTSGGTLALGPPILEIEPRCAATPGKKLRGELLPSRSYFQEVFWV